VESNIRNCHLIANDDVTRFIIARASHGVIPSFFSLAVAMAAYEMGYAEACRPICRADQCQPAGLDGVSEGKKRTIFDSSWGKATTLSLMLALAGVARLGRTASYWEIPAEEQGLACGAGVYFSRYRQLGALPYARRPSGHSELALRLREALDALA